MLPDYQLKFVSKCATFSVEWAILVYPFSACVEKAF